MGIINIQAELNNDTRNSYELWKPFRDANREQVYKLVFKRNFLNYNRALLLGAGNGNDIDINYFEGIFDEITIVDIDETAMDNLISRAKYPEKFIKRFIDLSGVGEQFNNFQFKGKSTSQIETFIRKLTVLHDFSSLTGEFDCIVNCNYTSQLVNPFIYSKLDEYKINPSTNLILLLSDLNKKIIINIFNNINQLLHEKGLFIHSTDTFELAHNEKTSYKSTGLEEILTALKGNLLDMTPLHNPETFSKLSKYLLVGNYIDADRFKFESLRYVPWKFSMNDDYVKYYICSVYVFKKGISINYNTINNL